MKTETALDEFGLLERRRSRGEDGRRTVAALAALREYLVGYAGLEDAESVRAADLFQFILDYYPSEEEPDVDVALALLDASAGFARWLVERGERGAAPFLLAEDRLREDLPRVLEALAELKEHFQRNDLEPEVLLEDEEDGAPVGAVGSGVSRVVRLDQVDYPAAEEDYFTIARVGPDSLTLTSAQREALGERPADNVRLPPEAAGRLRVGDIIHAEIAPGPMESNTWELLEVFGIRPGGYA